MPDLRFYLLSVLIALSFPLLAQPDCGGVFYPLRQGATYEQTHYDKKDKPTGKTRSSVEAVQRNGRQTEATWRTVHTDDKGKNERTQQFTIVCDAERTLLDARMILNADMVPNAEQMELKVDGDGLALPHTLQAGQALPDATLRMEGRSPDNPGMPATKITMKFTNRKVGAPEKVTTPRGTHEAFRLTQDLEIVTEVMGLKVPARLSTVEFYVPREGMVRAETYRKGKLVGYSVLTDVR